MALWKTDELIERIKKYIPEPFFIYKDEQMGDYTSEVIHIFDSEFPDENIDWDHYHITLVGFDPDSVVLNGAEVDVPLVEMRDSDSDGRGGIASMELSKKILAAHITQALQESGFDVVNSMEGYY